MIRKALMVIALAWAFSFVTLPVQGVMAVDVIGPACRDGASGATACQNNSVQPSQGSNSIYGANGVLTKVGRLLSMVVGIASVIMIIISGLKYVLASGDQSSIASAKNTLLYAIVGLVIAGSAQAIIFFVLNRL